MKEREKKDRVCVIMIYSERLPSASIVTTATVPSNFRDRPATPHHPHWLPQASPSILLRPTNYFMLTRWVLLSPHLGNILSPKTKLGDSYPQLDQTAKNGHIAEARMERADRKPYILGIAIRVHKIMTGREVKDQ